MCGSIIVALDRILACVSQASVIGGSATEVSVMSKLLTHVSKDFSGSQQRVFPEFNPAVSDANFGIHGVALERAFAWLDLTARTHGLTTLWTYCDLRPVPGGLSKWMKKLEKKPAEKVWADLVKAMDKTHGPWADWFPIEHGLAVVEGLSEILEREGWNTAVDTLRREYPAMMKGKFEPAAAADVVTDLRALAARLRIAGAAGARFRLARTNPFIP